ncbi:MAG: hypothetical protein J6T12_00335 [Salinivirgaceae bacterium]|nr:hypothetical protein [Salinivirgaceae bacterium]
MADNYLERHYEEYEAKKAAWEKAKKLGKVRPKKTVQPKTDAPKKQGGV